MLPNPTKKLPYSITKAQLVKMCYPVPERAVRNRINIIIYDNRKDKGFYKDLSIKEVIRTHVVEHHEIKEYFETYGLPPGFEF
ncbi:hypothetical protein [Flavobacterium sp.]|uniref:hypothetical protein n=1 Tax=Flavobacterium sp. TaxID=239 RepID=UPI002B4B20C3|nr:hypothetical protein [Flavobacterium sp.]HLF51880.1 hypothetical protein [Flavobacterium sp.]